jgi:hypothetical protein
MLRRGDLCDVDRAGTGTSAPVPYALIAAISGIMPMMFITRVRL